MRNLAKKYSLKFVSPFSVSGSGSLFRFNEAAVPARFLLPIIARSFAVASFITGMTFATPSLNSSRVPGVAKVVGLEKYSCSDQKVS